MSEDLDWKRVPEASAIGKNWLQLNEVREVKVENKTLCIGRTQNGYFAVQNKCPHAGGSLGKGWCNNAGQVVCPLHHYKFDLKSGRQYGEGLYRLKTYPLKWENDTLYVGLPSNNPFRIFGLLL